MKIITQPKPQIGFLFTDIEKQYQQFYGPGCQRSHRRACRAHFRSAEMAVNQHIINAAVNEKGDDRQLKGYIHQFHAPHGSKKDLCDGKEEICKTDDGQITDAFRND